MRHRILGRFARYALAVLGAVLLLPAVADAQQASSLFMPTTLPVGVTVVASGTFTATDVLNLYTVIPFKKGANAATLAQDLKAVGIGPTSLKVSILSTVVRVDPSRDAVLRGAVARAGFSVQGETSEPAHPEAASRAALAAAVQNARLKAETIAEADHRHIGKLINVEPAPSEYISGLVAQLRQFSPLAAFGVSQSPQVSATAIFTFELLP